MNQFEFANSLTLHASICFHNPFIPTIHNHILFYIHHGEYCFVIVNPLSPFVASSTSCVPITCIAIFIIRFSHLCRQYSQSTIRHAQTDSMTTTTSSSSGDRRIRPDSARARRRERRKEERRLAELAVKMGSDQDTDDTANDTESTIGTCIIAQSSTDVSPTTCTPNKPKNNRIRRRTSSASVASLESDATSVTDALSLCSSSCSTAGPTTQFKISQQSHRNNKKSTRTNNNKSKSKSPRKITVKVESISEEEKSRYVAIDCEMVGCGPGGYRSALARVSIVNWDGDVVLDKFVRVGEEVTDYRTFVSGITASDITSSDAISFDECRALVLQAIEDKIVVGHGLKSDFEVLQIRHEWHLIRDTARYQPFMKEHHSIEGLLFPKKLKELARDKLGLIIQQDGQQHDSIEDATAAMELYIKHRRKWEKAVEWKLNKTRSIMEQQN